MIVQDKAPLMGLEGRMREARERMAPEELPTGLTGRCRVRQGSWNGKLILQVEVAYYRWPSFASPSRLKEPGTYTKIWRDAITSDLAIGKGLSFTEPQKMDYSSC